MYCEAVINRKLALFTAKYGWTPVRHSIKEIEKATAYIKSLYQRNAKGELYFDDSSWTPTLTRFVQNERAMCAIDCEYFLTRYFKIASESRIINFEFRSGQRVFYSIVQDMEREGRPIMIQILKARQLGLSTLVEGIVTHRALFIPGAKCSIGSANDQKTTVMMGMMYLALEHIPWWLSPTQTKDRRSGAPMLEFSHIGTQIVIQSGSMKGGIGQGTTPTTVHLSEVSQFTAPVIQLEEGLFKALHSSPELFVVLESTGEGNTGWWADFWRANKETYFKGRSRWMPLFIPWFMAPDLYPTETWLSAAPIPADYRPSNETLAMTAKCELYAKSSPPLMKQLGSDWRLPIRQQWYWEFNFEDARRRKLEKSYLRHMPSDDYEALLGDNEVVFDADALVAIYQRIKQPVDIYGIIGEDIHDKHEPPVNDVDPRKAPIVVAWKTPKEVRIEWVLLPLKDDDYNDRRVFNELRKLLVYEHPQPNCDYSIGCDTGFGIGRDRTIISVCRTGHDDAPDVQVAEFASTDITNVEITTWIMAITAYYSKFMDDNQTPKLIIEQKRKYGDLAQKQMQLNGFRRHHEFVFYDKKTLKPKAGPGGRIGWFTNGWSRPMLLSVFKYAVENGWYQVNSRYLLEEIEAFEHVAMEGGKSRPDHKSGKHDDRIFAAAMAYFTMHDLDSMIERAKKKYNADRDNAPMEIDYGQYFPQIDGGGKEFLEYLSSGY